MVIDCPYAIEHKIRVIEYVDSKWYIDPIIEGIRAHWKLWVLAKKSVFILVWDPIDYQWTNPFPSNTFYLFFKEDILSLV